MKKKCLAIRTEWIGCQLVHVIPGQVARDEKKWNLFISGPVGWNCQWHDLRKQPLISFSREKGGKSLIFGRLSLTVKPAWHLSSGNKNQQFIKRHYSNIYFTLVIFQDVPSEDFSKTLIQSTIYVIQNSSFPHLISTFQIAQLSDLKPIENIWGILTHSIYKKWKAM